MAYLKPQSPLKNNDDYIYPLTTADQVIMEDGSRLNQLATPKAGFIYPLASDIVPEGFLLCDGAEYLRDEYPELFTAIGTIYGAGDGSTTFNVPNLQTRVPVGAGDGYELGATGGEEKHLLTTGEMPNHSHVLNFPFDTNTARPVAISQQDSYTQTTATTSGGNKLITDSITYTSSSASQPGYLVITGKTGNNQYHNNMQPYAVVNYIIATGKNTGVSIADIITGIQALPLSTEYGGTGATNIVDARKNLGVNNYVVDKVIYGKGKNLLKNTAKSQTINGITFTVNEDSSVTVNGTNNTQSADTDFYIWGSNADNGSYIHMPKGSRISGFTEDGGNYLVICREKTRGALLTTYSINSALAESDCYFYGIFYRVSAGITVDNVTLYPMLSLASETDDTYEPYYEGLKELTDRGMELVWENPSPTSAFESRSISLDFQDADMAFVEPSTGSGVIVRKGKVCEAGALNVWATGANSGNFHFRKIHLEDNGVHFYGGVVLNFTNGTAAENNDAWIPLRIYKIKGASA